MMKTGIRISLALGLLLACPMSLSEVKAANVDFVRGDTNADTSMDIGDAITTLDFLFLSKPIPCVASANANGDESMDIGDAIYLLNYLFIDGPPPAEPFPECGPDPIPGSLFPCESFPPCQTARPDPPRDLTCTPGPGEMEVTLAWTNAEAYDEIEIERDGAQIYLGASIETHLDATAGPGAQTYEVTAYLNGVASTAVSCAASLPVPSPEGFTCVQQVNQLVVRLTWQNAAAYDQVEIFRNGASIGTFPPASPRDDTVPGCGLYEYAIRGTIGAIASDTVPCSVGVTLVPAAASDVTCEQIGLDPQVELAWTNNGTYDAVEILRNGAQVAFLDLVATYTDTVPAQGEYTYAVVPHLCDNVAPPATCVVDVQTEVTPPADVQCIQRDNLFLVDLSWTNAMAYTKIEIYRGGEKVAEPAPASTAYADPVTACGTFAYEIKAYVGAHVSAPSPCSALVDVTPGAPQSLACAQAGGALTVALTWQNPTTYESIQVLREGELVATLAGTAAAHADAVPTYGDYAYQVIGTLCANPSSPASCAVHVGQPGPMNLACQDVDQRQGTNPLQERQLPGIFLSWTNPQAYDAIRILRSGLFVTDLPGTAQEHLDLVPAPGTYTYDILGIAGGTQTAAARCTIESAARTTEPLWATLRFDVERRITAADPATNVWIRTGTPVPINGWQFSIAWDPGLVFDHCEGELGPDLPHSLAGTCYEDEVDFGGLTPDFYVKQYWDTNVTVGLVLDLSAQESLPAEADRPVFRLRFRADPFVSGQVYGVRFEPMQTPTGVTLDNNVTGRTQVTPVPRWNNIWPLYLYAGEIRAE
ncbi:MAG: hypothetical protein JXP34_18080 [Planctomycetes bacterium]|nr:hypothetical protein [Planctomycetota bacterium]